MKYLLLAALTILPRMAKSCDFSSKDLLMITPGKASELEGENHILTVENTGNFVVTKRGDDSIIYSNNCYCEGSECPGEFEIKIQTDGNIFIITKDGHNDDKVWKNNKPGDQGIYALVIANDQLEVWKFEGDSDCPNYTKQMWTPSQGGICYGSDTPPSECDLSKDILLLSSDEQGKTFYGNEYTLKVTEESNLIISQDIYDNECYNSNADFCYDHFEVKLEDNGNAIVINEDGNFKVWESDKRGSQGTYALVVDDGEPQIWNFQGTRGCPKYTSKLWPYPNDNGKCYGSNIELGCSAWCDFSKDLLMITGEQNNEFMGKQYTLKVNEKGNVIIKQKNNGAIIYENNCYNSETKFCDTEFQIKLKNTGEALVIPVGKDDYDKVWRSNKIGTSGTYALVVHNNKPQIWRIEGDKDCPTYISKLWCKHDDDVCYGSNNPLDICDCDHTKDLLMVTNDEQQGNYFRGDDFTLEVRQRGNVVISRNDGGSIIYNNDCFNNDFHFCNTAFEIKLETSGNALVIPEGEDDDDHKVWQSSRTSSQGTYALVVHNNKPQIWRIEGDKYCPRYKEKVWCQHNGDVCHGSDRDMICTCDFTKDLLMLTSEKGKKFYGEAYTLEVENEGNFKVSRNSDGYIIYDNRCYRKDGICTQDFEIKLQTDGNAFVIPENGHNDNKIWKSNAPGSQQGTYALVVYGNKLQIWGFSGTKDCPVYTYMLWNEDKHSQLCYGSTQKHECARAPCDTKKAILMVTHDKGDSFSSMTKSSYLEVKDTGALVLTWLENVMFDNNCEADCRGRRFNRALCFSSYEVKLQDDAHLIIVPEGMDNKYKIWSTVNTGPVGLNYALVDNYSLSNGECLQIWSWNGDSNCPIFYEKIWDCSDCAWCKGDDICYET